MAKTFEEIQIRIANDEININASENMTKKPFANIEEIELIKLHLRKISFWVYLFMSLFESNILLTKTLVNSIS